MPYKVIVVDDEPLAIEVLVHYFREEKDWTIAATFTQSSEAITFINDNPIDLVLLDINMPGINGIEVLSKLTQKPLVIFTTAHKEYLQAGFDLGILDYLQKPIKADRLKKGLQRAIEILNQRLSTQEETKRILVKSGDKELLINLNSISLIQSARDYCFLFLELGHKKLITGSLNALQEKLKDTPDFVRVHRSFIIPLSKVETIKNNKTIIVRHHTIPIGRKYKEAFFKQLEKFTK